MVDIFHDVFGEAKPSQPEKTKTSRNNAPVDLEPRQVIYFGAPGTGKSYQLKEDSGKAGEKFAGQERITFYPGYSYQQFVGTYKRGMEGDKIVYKFVEGPLLNKNSLRIKYRTSCMETALKKEYKEKDFHGQKN